MKVALLLPRHEVEAEVVVAETSDRVDLTPYFTRPEAAAPVAYIEVRDDKGKLIDRAALQVSGANGKILLRSKMRRAIARLDQDVAGGEPESGSAIEPEIEDE